MLCFSYKKKKAGKGDEGPSLPGAFLNIRLAFVMKDRSAAVPKVLEWCRQQVIK